MVSGGQTQPQLQKLNSLRSANLANTTGKRYHELLKTHAPYAATCVQVFMGDDTWMQLAKDAFVEAHPYPSFDVHDLHTVDDGVWEVSSCTGSRCHAVYSQHCIFALHSSGCKHI